MTASLLEALHDVLEATAEPPHPDADPADVLVAGHAMTDAREGALLRLRGLMGDSVDIAAEARPVLEEIWARDARWQAALGRAGGELGRRAAAMRRVRHKTY